SQRLRSGVCSIPQELTRFRFDHVGHGREIGACCCRRVSTHACRPMILSRKFPDLPPKPETPQNAEFRRNFYARWGRANTVFCATTTRAEFSPLAGALSVKSIQNGSIRLLLDGRGVGLDDDHFVIVNRGEVYGAQFDSTRPVTAFSVFFRPGLAEE